MLFTDAPLSKRGRSIMFTGFARKSWIRFSNTFAASSPTFCRSRHTDVKHGDAYAVSMLDSYPTVVFLVFAGLMFPTLFALPIMAILIGIIGAMPLTGENSLIDHVIVNGVSSLAGNFIPVLIRCWLSQIMYRTGVITTIVKKAAELGGDKPFIVALALLVVSDFLFTVLVGTGAAAMVDTIALPLLMGIGIPADTAPNTQATILPFMTAITPKAVTSLVIMFCVLAPLSLYRGPMNVFGLGSGLLACITGVGTFSPILLGAMFVASSRWSHGACPTATQVVWATNYVGLDPVTCTKKVQLPNWLISIGTIIVVAIMYSAM